jgi:hypothetical protein
MNYEEYHQVRRVTRGQPAQYQYYFQCYFLHKYENYVEYHRSRRVKRGQPAQYQYYYQSFFLHKYELGGISPDQEGHKRLTCTVSILCLILFLSHIRILRTITGSGGSQEANLQKGTNSTSMSIVQCYFLHTCKLSGISIIHMVPCSILS